VAARVWTQNFAMPSFTPVTFAGGSPTVALALSPGGTLPTGLAFSTTTGAITGTPTSTLAATVFTVTATDGAGAQSSKTFTLTVNTALTTVQAIPSISLEQDVLVTPFTPVTASGGTAPLAFALTGGAVPTGLAFSTTTGQFTGTPTVLQAATVYTVTVTDANGATSFKTFSKGGIVGSQRGVGGGFFLLKDPEEITLLDVVMAEEGPLHLNHCIAQAGICVKDVFCPVHGAWHQIRKDFMATLSRYSFADLARQEELNLYKLASVG
jgi:DNA-binding IscR family transcriptional regulator